MPSAAKGGHSTPTPALLPGEMLTGPCQDWLPADAARLHVNVQVGSFSLG